MDVRFGLVRSSALPYVAPHHPESVMHPPASSLRPMKTRPLRSRFGFVLVLALGLKVVTTAATFPVELQRRDPATGQPSVSRTELDPARVGVVIVDMWNWHWCKTATARVGALVPRMKEVATQARALGMTIFWCPSDVADNYVGTVPYEAAFSATKMPLPTLTELNCPPAPDGGGCACGRERCQVNYGWDGMHPDLVMDDRDFMPNDLPTLYSLCRQRGLTHLIYLGVHTQVCLLGKSIGLRNLTRAGFQCILARDLTDAHARYDPAAGVTPETFTADVVAHFEKHLAPTINFADSLRRAGRWNDSIVVDPVRITPWGTPMRPHFFEQPVTVTLTAPWETNATLRYTLDGSALTASATEYRGPFEISATARVRAGAFVGDRAVCLPSEALFVRMNPLPPKPDVVLGDLKPARVAGPGHSPSSDDHRYSPVSRPPQTDRSNRGDPLRIRGTNYAHGLGVQAPNQLVYALKPEYRRFVALAGIDDRILDVNNGSNLARVPSVEFKVYVDGRLLAASPVIRISEPAWRFDIPLPVGGQRLELVTTDAGDGNREDLADWVEAGFVQ